MKKLCLSLLASLCLASAVSASEIRVAAAANIGYPLKDLLVEFHKLHPEIKVNYSLGASGGFNAQIKHGANYDVFLSANMTFAQDLESLAKRKSEVYTQGRLLLFSPTKEANLQNLKDAKCIAIANPKTAPYGKAATEVLSKVPNSGKIVQAMSISATLSQTLSACEFGFIAGSSKKQLEDSGYKASSFYFVDEELYEPILQGAILLKDSESAKLFYDFILSEKAKEIFSSYGYK